MKAIVIHQYGGPEVLEFEECPGQVQGPGEVLVGVAAASVNPIDYKRRAGLTKIFTPSSSRGLQESISGALWSRLGRECKAFLSATGCLL